MTTSTITPDDILSDEDNKHLSEMIAIKKHVYAFIDKTKLIQFILQLIDSSEVIKFERKSDRKFLNILHLTMSLVLDVHKASEKYELSDLIQLTSEDDNYKATITSRSNLIRSIVVIPFSELMNTILGVIIGIEIKEDYEYKDLVYEILPKDYISLRKNITSFVELTEEEKIKMNEEYKFMYSMASAFIFPSNSSDLNEDTGFTLEFLL
jgi:hypothetical protein